MEDGAGRLGSYRTFGDLLKYLRVRARLTQRELAIAVGYSEAQISRLESNKRKPNPLVITTLFVPTLGIENEPEAAVRLAALATAAVEAVPPDQASIAPAAFGDAALAISPFLGDREAAGDDWVTTHALAGLSILQRGLGDFSSGWAWLEKVLAHARSSGEAYNIAGLQREKAWMEWNRGAVRRARDLTLETIQLLDDMRAMLPKAALLNYAGCFNLALGNYREADDQFEEALRLCQEIGAFWYAQVSRAHYILRGCVLEGRLSEAEAVIEEIAAEDARAWLTLEDSTTLRFYGIKLLYEGEVERAAEVFSNNLKYIETQEVRTDLHGPLRDLGRVRMLQGQLPDARALFLRSLEEITREHRLPDFPELIDSLAFLNLAEANPDQAAHLLGVSDGLLLRMEMVRYPIYRPEYEQCRARAASVLGETAFQLAYKAGRKIAGEANPVPAILEMNQSGVSNGSV